MRQLERYFKQTMKDRGITATAIAARLGVSTAAVCERIRAGEAMRFDYAATLADFLDCDLLVQLIDRHTGKPLPCGKAPGLLIPSEK